MYTTYCETDVAGLLRIAGEVGELEHDLHLRRSHILNRLLHLIGGCMAVCSEIDPSSRTGWALSNSTTFGGDPPASLRAAAQQYVQGDLNALDPCVPPLLRKEQPAATVRREDVIDRSWYRSEHFNTLRRPWGIGESLYGKLTTPDGRALKLTLHRELNDRPFTERDVRLMQLFNENLAALYVSRATGAAHRRSPDPRVASLAPRLRPVLQRLLAGDSEKEAAIVLSLSPHTIHQYTKVIYRIFAVSSRGELMARFVTSADGLG